MAIIVDASSEGYEQTSPTLSTATWTFMCNYQTLTGRPAWGAILFRGNATTETIIAAGSGSGVSQHWAVWTGTTEINSTGATSVDNQWYHVCAVVDQAGSNYKLYIDGVERINASEGLTYTNTNLWIGNDEAFTAQFAFGPIVGANFPLPKRKRLTWLQR